MKKYYIHNGLEQQGPFDLEDLKTQKVSKDTMVWYEGKDGWSKAEEIEELHGLFVSLPPPFNKSVSPPPLNNLSQKEKPKPLEQPVISPTTNTGKSKMSNGMIVGIVVFLIALIVGGVFISKNNSDNNNYNYSPPPSNSTTNNSPPPDNNNSAPSNNNSNNYVPPTTEYQAPPTPPQKTEVELREELRQKEASNPPNYITANITPRVTLAFNTILEGRIFNSATMSGFKNIVLNVRFYSKTGVTLGDEKFTVMEFLPPSKNVAFKHKMQGFYKDWAKTTYEIVSAEPY